LIRENNFKFNGLDSEFSNEQSLILKMTKRDPSQRPSANDILISEEYKALLRDNDSYDNNQNEV